jgi:hypothetical protein
MSELAKRLDMTCDHLAGNTHVLAGDHLRVVNKLRDDILEFTRLLYKKESELVEAFHQIDRLRHLEDANALMLHELEAKKAELDTIKKRVANHRFLSRTEIAVKSLGGGVYVVSANEDLRLVRSSKLERLRCKYEGLKQQEKANKKIVESAYTLFTPKDPQ